MKIERKCYQKVEWQNGITVKKIPLAVGID
jgi:hypothetical protein